MEYPNQGGSYLVDKSTGKANLVHRTKSIAEAAAEEAASLPPAKPSAKAAAGAAAPAGAPASATTTTDQNAGTTGKGA